MQTQAEHWLRLKLTEDLIRQVQVDAFVGLKNKIATQEQVREAIMEFMFEATKRMLTITNPPISITKK